MLGVRNFATSRYFSKVKLLPSIIRYHKNVGKLRINHVKTFSQKTDTSIIIICTMCKNRV